MSSLFTRPRKVTDLIEDRCRVAVVDPGSSVLPFDYYFCLAQLRRAAQVTFLGSETRFNSEFLSELAQKDRIEVKVWPISKTVINRVLGAFNYLKLMIFLISQFRKFDEVYFHFPRSWVLEFLIFKLLGRRAIFCIHNAVPHNTSLRTHFGTRLLASAASRLLFVSDWTRRDFMSRYGSAYEDISTVFQHGIMAIDPLDDARDYELVDRFRGVAFWGNIKPYKGIELFRLKPEAWLPPAVDQRYLIAGRWDPQVTQLRDEYRSRREIELVDGFLSRVAVKELLAQDFVFVLPYRKASQSGILYTLLFYGRYFIATDEGDIGDFLKVNGLQELIVVDFSEAEMRRAIGWLLDNLKYVQSRLATAQQAYSW